MIRYISQKQLPLEGFDTPPGMILDPTNRWVKLRDCIPWDELSESYYKTLCSRLGVCRIGIVSIARMDNYWHIE